MNEVYISPSKEPVVLACACGAALKLTFARGKEFQADKIREAWNAEHSTGWEHEPATLREASKVRLEAYKERRRSA